MRLMSSFDALLSHAIAKRAGVNPTDVETMDLLNTLGPMTAGELSRRTGLTTGATTRLIDRLARKGYVRRTPDESDRRRVVIEPIEENLAPLQALFDPVIERMNAAWATFSHEELASILDFVRKSNAAVAEANAELRSALPQA